MVLIFIDESGYTADWVKGKTSQPFYVLAGVCIPAEVYSTASRECRKEFEGLGLPHCTVPLGQGFQLKCAPLARGEGYWNKNPKQRDSVREMLLSFPKRSGGTSFLIVVDLDAHYRKYAMPEVPWELATRFMFERLQHYLADKGDYGVCIFDQNKVIEDRLRSICTSFIREGSEIEFVSSFYGPTRYKYVIDRILEVTAASQETSIGLHWSEFLASLAYWYHKHGKPTEATWWKTIWDGLYSSKGVVQGVGYKHFP
jgi:hypothetical protein